MTAPVVCDNYLTCVGPKPAVGAFVATVIGAVAGRVTLLADWPMGVNGRAGSHTGPHRVRGVRSPAVLYAASWRFPSATPMLRDTLDILVQHHPLVTLSYTYSKHKHHDARPKIGYQFTRQGKPSRVYTYANPSPERSPITWRYTDAGWLRFSCGSGAPDVELKSHASAAIGMEEDLLGRAAEHPDAGLFMDAADNTTSVNIALELSRAGTLSVSNNLGAFGIVHLSARALARLAIERKLTGVWLTEGSVTAPSWLPTAIAQSSADLARIDAEETLVALLQGNYRHTDGGAQAHTVVNELRTLGVPIAEAAHLGCSLRVSSSLPTRAADFAAVAAGILLPQTLTRSPTGATAQRASTTGACPRSAQS